MSIEIRATSRSQRMIAWGGMLVHAVQDDPAAGRLVELQIEDIPQVD